MKKGLTLMEVIVAIFLLTLGILFVFTLVLQPFSFSGTPELKSIALYLAEEGLDLVENIRNGNFIQDRYSPSSLGYDYGLKNCSQGCKIDYTMIKNQNPILPTDNLNQHLNLDSNGFYSYQPGTETPFSRKIEISISGNEMIVTSIVSFSWKGTSHTVSVQRKLKNYLP